MPVATTPKSAPRRGKAAPGTKRAVHLVGSTPFADTETGPGG